MIQRLLRLPNKSFMLFGPRGTGKSTLIRSVCPIDVEIDLLRSKTFIPLVQNPSLLAEWTGHLKAKQWVFIDEIQKIPALLDEVHALYEQRHLHFALSGSSARKLRRGGANLLAGRALQTYLFPFVSREFEGLVTLDEAIEWGSLPLVMTDKKNRAQTLATYVETYLRQELLEEGLLRKLDPFARFLQIAGLYHGQILNVENVARESHIGRSTIDKYFQILEDTLIGLRVPALRLGLKAKESNHSKFYFFDSGVGRACAGLLDESVDSVWKGFALETFLLNELRAYIHYTNRNYNIYFYNIIGSYDIDFVIETKKKTLSSPREGTAIAVKYAKKWDPRWTPPLIDFQEQKKIKVKSAIGIYRGDRILSQGKVTVYPLDVFVKKLFNGQII